MIEFIITWPFCSNSFIFFVSFQTITLRSALKTECCIITITVRGQKIRNYKVTFKSVAFFPSPCPVGLNSTASGFNPACFPLAPNFLLLDIPPAIPIAALPGWVWDDCRGFLALPKDREAGWRNLQSANKISSINRTLEDNDSVRESYDPLTPSTPVTKSALDHLWPIRQLAIQKISMRVDHLNTTIIGAWRRCFDHCRLIIFGERWRRDRIAVCIFMSEGARRIVTILIFAK